MTAAIHASPYRLVAAVTGGGTKAISQLLEVPGGSRSVLEAVVPYSWASLIDWLGGEPDKACSEPTARAMAMAAWMRARELAGDVEVSSLVGIGATASLASSRPKRGEHRIHVAVQTEGLTATRSLVLAKGSRNRKKEQWIAAKLILLALGEACRVDTSAAAAALEAQLLDGESIVCCEQAAEENWRELLGGRERLVIGSPREKTVEQLPESLAVFPGAFNPLHGGHRKMAEIAASRLRVPVAFEISVTNVDKPPLDFVELTERVGAFRDEDDAPWLLLTDAPTFLEKSELLPGCRFVVGADTVVRIGEARYYEGGQAGCDAAIRTIAERGCRFLVFGREIDGEFQELSELELPAGLLDLCDAVAEAEFREDVSSTEIREGQE